MGSHEPTCEGTRGPPRLSVVMAVHNVAAYLHEALGSVVEQSYRDLEVVVVDDGATDASASIVARLADSDPRIRLVQQENAGLGAARNTGVAHARGAFLTFVDGDDVVAPGAYAEMVSTLDRTGSDMVVGSLERLGARHRRQGRLMRENHAQRREGVTLTEMPQMLADVFAVNKVFRRSFWDAASLGFPEGTHYEDQPAMTRAFLRADRFDVLSRTVYLWRRREDQSSITQNRHRIEDLQDRMDTKRDTVRTVLEARPDLRDLLYRRILPVDLWSYFEASVEASDEYWDVLRAATCEFWGPETLPFADTAVPAHQRLMGALVADDRRQDLVRVVSALNARSRHVPLRIRGDDVLLQLRALGLGPGEAPPGCAKLREHETTWEARVLDARWTRGRLALSGFALVENVTTAGRETSLSAQLVGADGAARSLEITGRHEPRATKRMSRPGQDYDDCGFELEIDAAQLAREHPPEGEPTTWRLAFTREVDGLIRRGGVTGYRTQSVDRAWRPVSDEVQARLRDVRGSLVLDLCLTAARAPTRAESWTPGEGPSVAPQTEYADSQRASSSYTRSRAG